MASINPPRFHPGYAALILIFLAVCASLFKPKSDYIPLKLSQFSLGSEWKNRRHFCLCRMQYWTIRFIFYYALPHVAIGLYLLTIALSIGIAYSRIQADLHANLSILRSQAVFCEDIDAPFAQDIVEVAAQTQSWSDQLTWLLTAYFFQKMFGATLLVNGGGSVLLSALLFDPWLLLTTFWGTHLEDRMLALIASPHMAQCYLKWPDGHAVFPAFELIVQGTDNVNMCLWTMAAMSLSAGLLIDIVCTSIRELEFCLKRDLDENDTIWNKLTCCITKTVQAMDDAVDEVLEDVGFKADASHSEQEHNVSHSL